MAELFPIVARIDPATSNYAGPIEVCTDEDTVLLFQEDDGTRDMIGIELPKIDELIAALQTAKQLLSAAHGAQGDPATTPDNVHETRDRQFPAEVSS